MKLLRSIVIVVAILGLGYFGYGYLSQQRPQIAPDSASAQAPSGMVTANSQAGQSATQRSSTADDTYAEIVRSIYDSGADFRQSAQSAAEDYIAGLASESMSRWQPVRIEPTDIVTGSYLEAGFGIDRCTTDHGR